MSRLTKKILPEYGMHYAATNNISVCQFNNKLGQLEDIEEEIGIELIKRDEIDKSSTCYVKENNKIKIVDIIESDRIGVWIETFDMTRKFLLYKDYGKTWALTREELENE